MLIKVISVEVDYAVAKNGNSYKVVTLVYKNRDGKVESKKLMPFGDTKKTAEILGEATAGQVYEVDTVKNNAGYWDWLNPRVSSGDGNASSSGAAQPASRGTSSPEPSRFESAEERAKKQVYIVRQSSLSNAVETLAVGSKTALDPQKVIEVARLYEAYVFDTEIAEVGATKAVSDLPDDDIDF